MSPFISPYSSPCSGMISAWVYYQLLFKQVLSPYAIPALPVTLVSGSERLSKPFSHVRLISQPPLPPSPAFISCGFWRQFVCFPSLPDQTGCMYSLTDEQCGITVFLPLLPLYVLWQFHSITIQIFVVYGLDDLLTVSCLHSCRFFLESLN